MEKRIHNKCHACNGEADSHLTPFFKDEGFYVKCRVCKAATKTYSDKRIAWMEWDGIEMNEEQICRSSSTLNK